MKPSAQLILVDGSSYLYRAFHAMPSLTTSSGHNTGAVYGVTNMLRRMLREFPGVPVVVVFDAKGKTFRDELYPEYKAHRPPMPDELRKQIPPLHAIVEAMGLPLLVIDGVEADDVIGTLARQATEQGMDCIISTGDKDMAQLVNQHVTLMNTMDNTTLDPQGVVEKFGIPPERIIDYLTLIGDSVDNIPGVPKVGPKTAVKWLDQYGSLDGVIAHADEIKGKVGENLRAALAQLPLSHQLATIRCDVPLAFGPTELTPKPADTEQLKKLFAELEFRTWLSELLPTATGTPTHADSSAAPAAESTAGQGATPPEAHYEIIQDEAAFDTWLERLRQAELFAFDTETTSLDYMQAKIVGVSFAVRAGEAAYVPVAHQVSLEDAGQGAQLDRDWVLERLRPLLEDATKAKLGQNLKYDMSVLANATTAANDRGITLRGVAFDTMLESYVLDSTATRHDMDSLAVKYLHRNTIHYEDVAGKGAKQVSFDQVPISAAGPYAAEDADVTLQLHQALWPKLAAEPRLAALFRDIEIPLLTVLSRIERNGVLIDAALLTAQSRELEQRLREIQDEAYAVAGEEFNLASPKQIQAILFDRLGLPVLKKTPKGAPSTAEEVLAELALDFPLPRLLLEHRGMSKLKSTYTDKLPQRINPVTGRVHTSYHQAVASTGRLSSSDPNLQNIPIRSAEGRRIRQAFIAPPGHTILAADYSQIELRIMAHLSDDPSLLQAFSAGEDIHRATAAEVFGLPLEEVDTEQRRSAKAINFGLIYGMSAFGLARQLGIPRGDAQKYIDLYFERYPGVQNFMDSTRESARELGYVETVFGRRLYLPEINHRNGQRRQYAERTAINAPMQGTAADIIKRAMIAVAQWIDTAGLDIKLIMQVHDELVFEIRDGQVEAARAEINRLMVGVAELKVPLVVDIGTGSNWDEAH
ncbi:MAG: DNA polymerase I [Gammaproteobacteria bacterium]|nr:DNA polymerase I [Gammaproteobacteria bacterium]